MKHAIIILAHEESENLQYLIDYFRGCDILIHFDKRAIISHKYIKNLKNNSPNVFIFNKIRVHWGGFSMLRCEMFMLNLAMKISDADYFHLISAYDYPIKSFDEFLNFFNLNAGKNFLSYTHLPNVKWQNNTFKRLQYFYFTDLYKDKKTAFRSIKTAIHIQQKLHIKRFVPKIFDHYYGGSQWFSLTRMAVGVLLDFTKHNRSFYRRFLWTFAPEEVYIHTVLVNLLPSYFIVPYNFRFIRWKNENGNNPSNLGIEHFHLLVESNALFARKILDTNYALKSLINKYLVYDSKLLVTTNSEYDYNGFKIFKYDCNFIYSIVQYAEGIKCTEVLDAGCGAGLCVAALRRLGLNATGFDINIYTKELSSLLIPEGDEPCQIADLTKLIDCDSSFEIVLCLDVLETISKEKWPIVLRNLILLTKHSLILSFETLNNLNINEILEFFYKEKFRINQFATSFLNKNSDKYKNIILMERDQK